MRADGELKQDVEAELRCHPDVDETGIAVDVMWGVVRLSGYVRNLFDKYGAEDAVRRARVSIRWRTTSGCGSGESRVRTLPNSAVRGRELTSAPG